MSAALSSTVCPFSGFNTPNAANASNSVNANSANTSNAGVSSNTVMSRSGNSRVASVTRRKDSRQLCAYTHRVCLQNKLEGFEFCIRHILVDKSAPFKQCSFVHPQSGKRCPNAARRTERRDATLCPWHIKKLYLKRKLQHQQQFCVDDQNVKSPDLKSLMKDLEHYCPEDHEKRRVKSDWIKQEDESTTASDYLRLKIAEAAANVNESDSENDLNNPLVDDTLRSDVIDSDSESMDSDKEDPLKHAGVYTAEEVSLLLRDKMLRLQSLYINQFKHLQYLLKEKRKKYLQTVKNEKDMSAAGSLTATKNPEKAINDLAKLKALSKYHRYSGREALLKRQAQGKRRAANASTDSVPCKQFIGCIFLVNDEPCNDKALPLTHYCRKHILYDSHQVLFRPCAAGNPPCLNPIISFQHKNTCILHKDFKSDTDDGIDDSGHIGTSNAEPELFQTMDDIASLGLDAVAPGSLFGLDQFGELGETESTQDN
ncbi:KAT8 regulatory NSL complex subunit 2-like protein [Leptotrombidium deliense]|uniref:KAT8 regulatory NSL complex subunit 2 n=1 Tax=Leptotrombidium deliense TaxID=299467 RepID=A0A443SUS6_9ACAR|nr:KAT8 regulatory NSL complex subunit 2-like protein [Leptotrombidium deliense]